MLDLFEKWYRDYKEDQGLMIAVGMSPDNEEVPQELALTWFKRRHKQIIRKLNIDNDQLTIFRCMSVDKNWVKKFVSGDIAEVGDHWTLDRELVVFLKGGFGGKVSEKNIILEAIVHKDDFDILSLFQPSYAEEYEEFEILPKKVIIKKTHNGDFTKILAEVSFEINCRN